MSLGAFVAAPAGADTVPPTAPAAVAPGGFGAGVSTFTLANGLQVVVIPDRRAPVVTHMVWYRAGAADEPVGRSGIAHYLEHLMFKGTRTHPGDAFSKAVATIGGQENAFTSSDYTAYHQRVAKQHLGLMMELEADRMQNLALDPATAAPELKVVLEERSMRIDNDPAARLGEAMDAMLHPNHPYRIPVIGWRHEIETLTVADAIAFYDRFYTPNNAVLVVAGDVDAAEVRTLAEATYGRVPRRAEPGVRHRPQDPPSTATRAVVLADERVTQGSWRRLYEVPSQRSAAPGESEALEVMADLLGGGATSRLYRALVIDKGVAAQVGAWYQSGAVDDTRLMIYATPRDGVSIDELARAVDAVVADLAATGPTPEETARAVNRVVAAAIRAQDNQATLARIFGEELALGGSVDSLRGWPARIAAVAPAAIRAAAAKYLVPERAVTGELRVAPSTGKAQPKAAWPAAGPGAFGPIRRGEPAPLGPLGRGVEP
ncbi:insulinase family protein [Siculibacillus lacustris]|uniref:Insulinase family protein n=1 Tax=Siculibacillus lacustris TaxID=1549641 RepID=A0A4Q9VE80_9HYPH|nr:insulinase family protein [Siculibacillus lacustris]